MSVVHHQPTGFIPIADDDLAWMTDEERESYDLYVVSENYLDKPDEFVAEVLDEYLWSIQAEIAYSVRDNRHTAVPSCHDAGKSFVVSRIAAWWINSHAPGEAFVVSTAPTFPQVRAILWREINIAHSRGGLVGSVNQTEWHLDGKLVGYGRKPADTNAQGFQGIHARYVLVIIDEANGVSKAIFDAVETLATNEDARVIAIGNPDDPTSEFAEVCKPGSGWTVIEIDGYNTPNLTGEWVPPGVRPLLLSPTWIEERKRMWGEDSALFMSKVRGKFPEGAADGVVRYAGVARCQYVEPDTSGPIEIGLDVGASVDGDATVMRVRRGNIPGEEIEMHTDDSNVIVERAIELILETKATAIKVDVIGVGFGVAGGIRAGLARLKKEQRAAAKREERGLTSEEQKQFDCKVVPVNVSEESSNKKLYKNLRSQIWWEIGREAFDEGLYATGLMDKDRPHDQQLDTIGELLAPKFTENTKGQIIVEPKADTKKRIGKSPDHADAFLLAFYQSVKHGPGKTTGRQVRGARIG